MLRRLARIQLGLAAYAAVTFLVSQEWIAEVSELWKKSSVPPWASVRPKANEDVKFTASHKGNCELSAFAGVGRSLDCNGYVGTLTLNSELSLGNSENPEGNIALRLSSGMSTAGTGPLNLVGTHATTSTIDLAGKTISWTVKTATTSTASYKLLSAFKTTSTISLKPTGGTPKFEVNGQIVECTSFVAEGTVSLDLTGKSKIVCTGTGTAAGFTFAGTGSVQNGSESTIEVGSSESTEVANLFSGGGQAYGTVKLGKFVSVGGSNSYAVELAVNSKGAAEGKGVRLAHGAVTTLNGVITSDGTKASPARLESDEAGKQHTIKGTGNKKIAGTVVIHDIKYEGGIIYVECGGSAEAQKEAEEKSSGYTNIVFGPEPGEEVFSGTATLRAGTGIGSTGGKVSSGAATLRAGASLAASAAKSASGASQLRSGPTIGSQGLKAASGAATARSGATIGSAGGKVGQGAGVLRSAARILSGAGIKTAGGSGVLRAGTALVATTNELVFGGTAVISAAVRTISSGVKAATGQGQVSAGARVSASSGAKTAGGTGRLSVAGRVISAGRKSTFGQALIRIATRILEGATVGPAPAPLAFARAGAPRALVVATGRPAELVVTGRAGAPRLAVYALAGEATL